MNKKKFLSKSANSFLQDAFNIKVNNQAFIFSILIELRCTRNTKTSQHEEKITKMSKRNKATLMSSDPYIKNELWANDV